MNRRAQSGMENSPPVLVVHGGAWEIPEDAHHAHVTGCERAAETGWAILAEGGSALDAIEVAVRLMVDDPTFDAGRGSFLNGRGEVELNAIIMDGRDLNLGAVAAVQRVRNPVTLARLVMCRASTPSWWGLEQRRSPGTTGYLSAPPRSYWWGEN